MPAWPPGLNFPLLKLSWSNGIQNLNDHGKPVLQVHWGTLLIPIYLCCWGPPDGPINVASNRVEMNARVAAALGSPVLMVLDAPPDLTVQVLQACTKT